jgi:hypothetical protein
MFSTWCLLMLLMAPSLVVSQLDPPLLSSAGNVLKTYLLLDSRNVQDSGGARLVLGPVRKHGKPVLTEQEKWVRLHPLARKFPCFLDFVLWSSSESCCWVLTRKQ